MFHGACGCPGSCDRAAQETPGEGPGGKIGACCTMTVGAPSSFGPPPARPATPRLPFHVHSYLVGCVGAGLCFPPGLAGKLRHGSSKYVGGRERIRILFSGWCLTSSHPFSPSPLPQKKGGGGHPTGRRDPSRLSALPGHLGSPASWGDRASGGVKGLWDY